MSPRFESEAEEFCPRSRSETAGESVDSSRISRRRDRGIRTGRNRSDFYNGLLEGLKKIGVDEVLYRKGHRCLTLVSSHETRRIAWAKDGKTAGTFAAFFEDLGEERCRQIEPVSMDMSEAYIQTTHQKVPQAQIVFDRFHVQGQVSQALDETRREEWRRRRSISEEAARELKGMRWAVLKNPWNLTSVQSSRLSDLPKENARLYRAYFLKESFAGILDRPSNVAREKPRDWLSWASRSRLPAFVKAGRTIRKHFDDIVAYVRYRFTNSVAEGLNNKVRLLTRRA